MNKEYTYLAYQLCYLQKDNDIRFDVIIRRILAKNREEAIGKFVTHTEAVLPNFFKLNISCFEEETLISIR